MRLKIMKVLEDAKGNSDESRGVGKYNGNLVSAEAYKKRGSKAFNYHQKDGLSFMDDIDLRGTRFYKERPNSDLSGHRDKICAEEDVYKILEDGPWTHKRRNMLLRLLFDHDCPTNAQCRKMIKRSVHTHKSG
jgi:hypothetical protein